MFFILHSYSMILVVLAMSAPQPPSRRSNKHYRRCSAPLKLTRTKSLFCIGPSQGGEYENLRSSELYRREVRRELHFLEEYVASNFRIEE
jgi:hypothetical protein